MPNCKKCGKKFHACGSCCLTYDYEYYYCSDKCWEGSDEYKEQAEKINRIFNSLPQELWGDLENILGDDDNYNIFNKIYKERIDKIFI